MLRVYSIWSMSDLANAKAGGAIIASSCLDQKHPPSCMIDGNSKTFWLTTGSYPQMVVLQLPGPCSIKGVEIVASGIKKIELSACDGAQPAPWDSIFEEDVEDSDGDIQRIPIQISSKITANFIRLTVLIALPYFQLIDILFADKIWLVRLYFGSQIFGHWEFEVLVA